MNNIMSHFSSDYISSLGGKKSFEIIKQFYSSGDVYLNWKIYQGWKLFNSPQECGEFLNLNNITTWDQILDCGYPVLDGPEGENGPSLVLTL